MTHLTSLILFRGLGWFLNTDTDKFQLQSLPLTTGSYFSIAYRKLTLNYAMAFITFYPLIQSSVSPRVLYIWIGIKLTEGVNLFMLYISDKFHYQNLLQKSNA